MSQLHRRFTDEQVKVLLQGYCQGKMTRADIQDILGIRTTHFFALLNSYRHRLLTPSQRQTRAAVPLQQSPRALHCWPLNPRLAPKILPALVLRRQSFKELANGSDRLKP